MDLDPLNLVSAAATVFTVGLFSTGILTCWKIHLSKSVGTVPHLPFVAAAVNCCLWTTYGVLKPDNTVFLVNCIGFLEQLSYILIYHTYADDKYGIRRDFILALVVVVPIVFYYSQLVSDPATLQTQLGVICNFFTILFFASPLATMAEVVRSQSTETMSFPLSLMAFLASLSWTIYGTMVSDKFIQFPNVVGMILTVVQLSLFLIYGNKKKKRTIVSLETPMV